MSLKIIQFKNGKYGIYGGFFRGYLDRTDYYFWSGRDMIAKYCVFETYEKCKQQFDKYNLW